MHKLAIAIAITLGLAACGPATEWVEVSVLTIDLHQDLDFWPDRFPLVADAIAADPPDLIAAQEVRLDLEQPAVLARMIRDRDARLSYDWYQERRSGDFRVTGEGLASFARHPVATRAVHDLGEGRIALFTRLRLSDRLPVDLYNVHLDGRSDEATRRREVGALLAVVAAYDRGYPTLIAGSLVSTPDGAALLDLGEAGFEDAWTAATGSPSGGPTEPLGAGSDGPLRRTDYVLVRRSERGAQVRVIGAETALGAPNGHGLHASDHLAVRARVAVDLATLP